MVTIVVCEERNIDTLARLCSCIWTWQRTGTVSTNLLDRSGIHELRLYASCVREINTDCTFNVVLSRYYYYNAKKTCISSSHIFSIYTIYIYTRTTGCFEKNNVVYNLCRKCLKYCYRHGTSNENNTEQVMWWQYGFID